MSDIVFRHLSGGTEDNYEIIVSCKCWLVQKGLNEGPSAYEAPQPATLDPDVPLSASVYVQQRNTLWIQRQVQVATFTPGRRPQVSFGQEIREQTRNSIRSD